MNDEHVIDKLRAAALGGPPATVETAAAVAAGGRKLRRRRQTLIGGTATLCMAAVALAAAHFGGGGQAVVQEAAPVATHSPKPITDTSWMQRSTRNQERLQRALGDDWKVQYGYKPQPVASGVQLDRNSTAAKGLPSGADATANISVDQIGGVTTECGPTPSDFGGVGCRRYEAAPGKWVRLIHRTVTNTTEPFVTTNVEYLRPDGVSASIDLTIYVSPAKAPQLREATVWRAQYDYALMATAVDPEYEVVHPTDPDHPVAQPTPSGPAAPVCSDNAIRIDVVPSRAERILLLSLRNASAEACQLQGYPTITMFDSDHRAIAFAYRRSTVETARATVVEPGGLAAVMLAKDTCTAGDVTRTVSLALLLPGSSRAHTVALPTDHDLSWCGAGDPGSTVTLNPIQGTVEATPAP